MKHLHDIPWDVLLVWLTLLSITFGFWYAVLTFTVPAIERYHAVVSAISRALGTH